MLAVAGWKLPGRLAFFEWALRSADAAIETWGGAKMGEQPQLWRSGGMPPCRVRGGRGIPSFLCAPWSLLYGDAPAATPEQQQEQQSNNRRRRWG